MERFKKNCLETVRSLIIQYMAKFSFQKGSNSKKNNGFIVCICTLYGLNICFVLIIQCKGFKGLTLEKNKQNGRTVWLADGRVENMIESPLLYVIWNLRCFILWSSGFYVPKHSNIIFPSQGVVLENILLYMGSSPGPNLNKKRG